MERKPITATILAMLLFITAAPSVAQVQNQPYIDISTSVEREVTPNELYLRITISESDYKGKKSLEEMQESMIGALKTLRIDVPECLTLNYMGSDIGYTSFLKKIELRSEATYTLKLYDVAIMQKVIAALEERQISNIELDHVKFTKESELKTEMAVEAMKQAQSEARTLAGAIGQEIGKALSISSWMSGAQGVPRLYKARAAGNTEEVTADTANGEPVIGIGKLTYRFNVNVRFELK